LPALGADAVLVTFTSGTGDSSGSLTVTNATTGSTTTSGLAPHSPPAACANALSLAAPKVGFRAELSGISVRIIGRGVLVKVVGATIIKNDAAAGGSRSPSTPPDGGSQSLRLADDGAQAFGLRGVQQHIGRTDPGKSLGPGHCSHKPSVHTPMARKLLEALAFGTVTDDDERIQSICLSDVLDDPIDSLCADQARDAHGDA
jgi:hypothetical protein